VERPQPDPHPALGEFVSITLNTQFLANQVAFALQHPLQPVDSTVRTRFKTRRVMSMDADPGPDPVTHAPRLPKVHAQDYESVESESRVVFGDFSPGAAQQSTAGAYVLRMSADYAAGHFPLFWLPFELEKARKITLRDKRDPDTVRQTGGEVRSFFTTAVNGCSVFVEGSLEAPTVYHLNGVDIQSDTPHSGDGTTKAHDDRILRTFGLEKRWNHIRPPSGSQGPKAVGQTIVPSAVLHPGEYIPSYFFNEPGVLTAEEQSYMTRAAGLVAVPLASAEKVEIRHNACVFGFKSRAGQWEFWYQRRAWVRLRDTRNDTRHTVYVGAGVKQFWPGAGTNLIVRDAGALHSFYVVNR
jgi:hypothetical protein